MSFNFNKYNDLFLQKKIQTFPFHIYFSHLCKFSLVMTCVFECFESHCHILKELYEFLWMMSAIIIFEESTSYLLAGPACL
jgi:hypothetical protein